MVASQSQGGRGSAKRNLGIGGGRQFVVTDVVSMPEAELAEEVNRLENVGDSLRDDVLAELFETAKDPIMVIKLKEIYQDSETVLDICEDLAHVVNSVLIKQA